MKTFILFLSLFVPSICLSDVPSPQIFIMLDIDNTLIDKIAPNGKAADSEYANKLLENGFLVQSFQFYSTKGQDPFFEIYKKQQNTRMIIDVESEEKLKISETIAIRPSMVNFLKEITNLKMPVHILICSRGGDFRAQNLVDNLKLEINNKPFKDVVDFVPREKFRVEIRSGKEHKTIGNSAWNLRKNYAGKFGKIKNTDYVILIAQLRDHQFIYSNPKKDLNIYLPPFYTKTTSLLKPDEDKKTMEMLVEQIKSFVK